MNQQMHVRTSEPDQAANRLTTVLFIVYLLALCWILLLKLGVRFTYMESRRFNLVPFNEPSVLNGRTDAGEIILNALIFVPLGIYAGVLFARWSFREKLLFFFLVSFGIEGLQFLLAIGAFDATDIVMNTFGAVTGLFLFRAIETAFINQFKAQKFINAVAATGTVLLVLFLLLLKLNLLPLRYQ